MVCTNIINSQIGQENGPAAAASTPTPLTNAVLPGVAAQLSRPRVDSCGRRSYFELVYGSDDTALEVVWFFLFALLDDDFIRLEESLSSSSELDYSATQYQRIGVSFPQDPTPLCYITEDEDELELELDDPFLCLSLRPFLRLIAHQYRRKFRRR